jgi:hypothetical protein
MKLESAAFSWMLEDTPIFSDNEKRRRKTPPIIVYLITPPLMVDGRQLVPSVAWRMSYNRMRTPISPRISRFVPRINTRQSEINPIRLDKKEQQSRTVSASKY